MQGEKIEAWFVSPSSREYFGVESPAFTDELLNMCFYISEAIKIAVSFSKFQCLYAMLLLRYNSKYGFSVA